MLKFIFKRFLCLVANISQLQRNFYQNRSFRGKLLDDKMRGAIIIYLFIIIKGSFPLVFLLSLYVQP